MKNRLTLPLLFACLLAHASQAPAKAEAEVKAETKEKLSFNKDVRPILSDNCFRCHGPDEEERKAKLRLDVPGEFDTDEFLARITTTDPDDIMPPPESNKSLDLAEIDTLKRWLDEGTPYEEHWAFVAPRRPSVPAETAHPIDYFIDQKLAAAHLTPNPAADPFTLVRRLHLDLIGLPPTPEKADAFVEKSIRNPQSAIANATDRLLASPHYGERWARHWLDLARYADTNGYEKDRTRSIWPYRDWVIRALNADMPFDQFTIEQLAGDMLPDPTPDQLVATGFHRNTMLNEEGGIDPLEFRFHSMADRVGTTGTAWLGLTTSCAQCHTHKYDPITHHDYYGIMAYLNNADEPDYLIRDPDALTQHQNNIAEAERLIAELPNHWPEGNRASQYLRILPNSVATSSGAKAEIEKDSAQQRGIITITGKNPDKDTYTAILETGVQNITGLMLVTHSEGGKGGRTSHGNFVLSEIEVTAAPLDGSAKPKKLRVASAVAEIEQPGFGVALASDGKLDTGWAIHHPDKPLNEGRQAIFKLEEPVGFEKGTRFEIKLIQNHGGQHTIGKFDLSVGFPAKDDRAPTREDLLEKTFARWQTDQQKQAVDWKPLEPSQLEANVPYLTHEGDGVVYVGGDNSKHDILSLTFPPSDKPVSALRLEALPDERLPDGGPGTTFYEGRKGDFYLTEFKVAGAKIASATESYAKNKYGNNPVSAKLATDGDIQTGWSVAGRIGERHVAVFVFEKPIPAGKPIDLEMHFGRHYASSLGKFRISATSAKDAVANERSSKIDALLLKPDLTARESAELKTAFLLQAPELATRAARIRDLQKPPSGTLTLIMQERPASHPRPTFLHHRGEFTQPKEKVEPRLPEAIYPPDKPLPKNRLEFARWLVSKENPLTARVIVNRHWAALFGTGLVKTLDDFGMQGSLPSHPELLDWLAVEFMESGWSLKHLHRTIVTSNTYRRSSHFLPEHLEKDPQNTLLARAPRFRLEAEIVRDSALHAAGLLSDKKFGPPVRPPQPAGVTEGAYGNPKWNPSTGEDRFRRSLYTFIKRTAPFAMFTTFDAPSGEACVAQRDASNTALQALTLMNDPMFVEIAEKMGSSLAAEPGDKKAKLHRAFRRILTRPPTEDEIALLQPFLKAHDFPALCRALLSLDESITRN